MEAPGVAPELKDLARAPEDVLLDHLHRIRGHPGYDGDMSVGRIAKHQEIIRRRQDVAAVLKLKHAPPWIQTPVWDRRIEEVLRVAHGIGHPVSIHLKVEAFHELDALPLLTKVVTLG